METNFIYLAIDTFSYITPLILIIGIIVFYVKRTQKTSLKFFILFLILSLSNDLLSRVVSHYYQNNLMFINTYNIIEVVCLFLIIKANSINFSPYLKLILLGILFYNFYELVDTDYQDYSKYQNYSNSINCIFLLVVCFSQLIKHIKTEKYGLTYQLYIYLIIYLTFSTFLNLPMNFFVTYNSDIIYIIWLTNIINVSAFYTYIVYILWKNGKTQTS